MRLLRKFRHSSKLFHENYYDYPAKMPPGMENFGKDRADNSKVSDKTKKSEKGTSRAYSKKDEGQNHQLGHPNKP